MWEKLHNPDLNPIEFEGLKNKAGANAFTMSLKKWIESTTKEELIEIPAGMFEENETDGLVVAKRELLEETGYVSDNWVYFGETVESSAKLSNRMHIYMATGCRKVQDQKLDETEDLEVFVVPFDEAVNMVMRNEIKCNSSAHGILRAAMDKIQKTTVFKKMICTLFTGQPVRRVFLCVTAMSSKRHV